MRRKWIVVAMVLAFAAGGTALRAQDATPQEKERALKYLESTRKGVEEA